MDRRQVFRAGFVVIYLPANLQVPEYRRYKLIKAYVMTSMSSPRKLETKNGCSDWRCYRTSCAIGVSAAC